MVDYQNFKISFKNEYLIMERSINGRIKDYEMNYSYNPTLLVSGSNENMVYFASGSSFTPYASTIGFYNDSNELLAVAKFGQPLPMSPDTDTNIIIRMDV